MRSVLATYLTIPAFELASSVKISNFEAHAEYEYSTPNELLGEQTTLYYFERGCV